MRNRHVATMAASGENKRAAKQCPVKIRRKNVNLSFHTLDSSVLECDLEETILSTQATVDKS